MGCDSQEASPGASRHALNTSPVSQTVSRATETSQLERRKLTIDVLLVAGEVNGLEATDLLRGTGNGRTSLPRQAPAGGGEGALLNSGRRHLAGQLRAESPGEAPGGHCDGDVRRKGGERRWCFVLRRGCGWGESLGRGEGRKSFRFWAVDGK